MLYSLTIINALFFFSLGMIHLYWAVGGKRGLQTTIPTDGHGSKLFQPGAGITLVVAVGLFFFGLCNLAISNLLVVGLDPLFLQWGMLIIAVVFFIRAIGDFRYIGLTKKYRRSSFAKMDSWCYTPLCLALAISHFYLYFL